MSQEGVKAGGNQEAEGPKLRVSGHQSTARTRRRDAVVEAGLSGGFKRVNDLFDDGRLSVACAFAFGSRLI